MGDDPFRPTRGGGDAAAPIGEGAGSYGAVDDTGRQPQAAPAEMDRAKRAAKFAKQTFDKTAANVRVSLRDFPAMLTPWAFFVVCLVPVALMVDPMLSNLALILCSVLGVGFLLLSNGRAWKLLALICLVATAAGYFLGRYDRGKYLLSYLVYSRSPYHTNVLPSEPPGAFADTGYIDFSVDSHIDPSRSFGYQSDELWCVAPIVGSSHTELYSVVGQKIGFWAVGQNCCRHRGRFECGDVMNPVVHGGLAVLDTGGFSDPLLPTYLLAARAAAATYGIVLPEEPVFVKWSERPGEALATMFDDALNFALTAIFACLVIVPVFVVILNFFQIGITNKEDGPHWHLSELQIMSFGVEFNPRVYDSKVKEGLLHMRCYWSGEVLYDYAFSVCNKHMFLSCFFSHPANPSSKIESIIVAVLVSLLIVFPVAAFSLGHGSGIWRTLLILFLVLYPRNVLRLYLIHINVQQEMSELSQGFEQGPAAKQALTREVIFFSVALVVIALICLACSFYILQSTDQFLGLALLQGLPALGFAFILEPLFDLIVPCVSKTANDEDSWVIGFFGRWRLERDTYPDMPPLYAAGEEIFLGTELREERRLIRKNSFEQKADMEL